MDDGGAYGDGEPDTPALVMCVASGADDVAAAAVRRFTGGVNRYGHHGWTPLAVAAWQGKAHTISALAEKVSGVAVVGGDVVLPLL